MIEMSKLHKLGQLIGKHLPAYKQQEAQNLILDILEERRQQATELERAMFVEELTTLRDCLKYQIAWLDPEEEEAALKFVNDLITQFGDDQK